MEGQGAAVKGGQVFIQHGIFQLAGAVHGGHPDFRNGVIGDDAVQSAVRKPHLLDGHIGRLIPQCDLAYGHILAQVQPYIIGIFRQGIRCESDGLVAAGVGFARIGRKGYRLEVFPVLGHLGRQRPRLDIGLDGDIGHMGPAVEDLVIRPLGFHQLPVPAKGGGVAVLEKFHLGSGIHPLIIISSFRTASLSPQQKTARRFAECA